MAQAGLRQGELGGVCDCQWADKALLRSTPALLGPFSIITLFAHDLAKSEKLKIRTAAWYPKASRPSATRSQRPPRNTILEMRGGLVVRSLGRKTYRDQKVLD